MTSCLLNFLLGATVCGTLRNPLSRSESPQKLIKDVLIANGFDIEEDILGVPSMFIASFGKEGPAVGLLAEYDADRYSEADDVPFPSSGNRVHSSGHNLLGIGCLGAALAIKKQIEKGALTGTVKYYGTTAEGGLGTRAYLARDGYFDDLDLAIFWHPSPVVSVNPTPWDAIIDFEVEFPGANGVFEAAQLVDFLGSRKRDYGDTLLVRAHMLSDSEDVAFAPVKTTAFLRIEHPNQEVANRLYDEVVARTRELSTSAEVTVSLAVQEFIPNMQTADLVATNMNLLGELQISQDSLMATVVSYLEQEPRPLIVSPVPRRTFGRRLPLRGYGSDIGDVSRLVPEMSFVVTCLPLGISMNNWQGGVFTGSDMGHQGMLYAAKVMASSLVDYLADSELRIAIREEFETRTAGLKYRVLIPDGPPDPKQNRRRSY